MPENDRKNLKIKIWEIVLISGKSMDIGILEEQMPFIISFFL
jgi:hypothetical protein